MSLVPDEELKGRPHVNLTPMVDFLFVVLAIFATLAVTRAVLYDTEISLARHKPDEKQKPLATAHEESYLVTLSVNENGGYKWITEFNEYRMDSVETIQKQLIKQQELGLLPKEKEKTHVLVHIDKRAQWDSVSELIFAVRAAGFKIHPVYEASE